MIKQITSPNDLYEWYSIDSDKFDKGHSGSVFRAVRKSDGKPVVIKECIFKPNKKDYCYIEWNIINSLKKHANIVTFYDLFYTQPTDGKTEPRRYIVMESCEQNLLAILENSEPLNEQMTAKIIKQLLYALYHLKINNIIHQDIKPENVVLCGDTIKLIDFGLAVKYNPFSRSRGAGTPDYIAPENLTHIAPPPNYAGDMHALGVLTYELLTGMPPYNSDDIKKIIHNIRYNNRQFDNLLVNVSPQDRDCIDKLIGISRFRLGITKRMSVE